MITEFLNSKEDLAFWPQLQQNKEEIELTDLFYELLQQWGKERPLQKYGKWRFNGKEVHPATKLGWAQKVGFFRGDFLSLCHLSPLSLPFLSFAGTKRMKRRRRTKIK